MVNNVQHRFDLKDALKPFFTDLDRHRSRTGKNKKSLDAVLLAR